MSPVERIAITVHGRPAPQGSKKLGQHGQLLEQSAHLPAWRAAVKRAVYEEYQRLGIEPADLPLLRGPVRVTRCVFTPGHGNRIDGPPDLDKLLRSTWDALTFARVWEDDGRVVAVDGVSKVPGDVPGVELVIEVAG